MSRVKLGATRSTGNVKHKTTSAEPDPSARKPPDFTGISGVSMPIPETKSLTAHFDAIKVHKGHTKKSVSEKHEISAKDATIKDSTYDQKQLMERISMLEKENAQLKAQLKEKEVTINNISKQMQQEISEYNDLVKLEYQSHEWLKEKLKQAEALAAEKFHCLHECRKEFEEKTEHLKKLYEEKIATMTREKASEIACRDEKIRKLKQQVSEILQGKSWERQQQLDELKKEIIRLTEEASTLQKKLQFQQSF
ncbi:uncharacterized protein LOC132402916 isoform X1 [Hypanus sabinus]|uniref:uncharacterized protein LOC132402916 isoform X1 n=1 Tax=Hypanus sabinus TaxID=79690 RepID=UPI0028C44D55|nr:uncharacterized protein LOC132402916 isoform X1 [Hypanus sabinus]XP_059841992.1 uncharacterized protein LOC132402916 isoform X1 [Hypanus sabinus]